MTSRTQLAVAPPAPQSRSKQGALAALGLSVLLASSATSMANIALPTLARAFNASFQEVQWVVLAYLLSVTTLIVGIGRLGDMFGRKRLLLLGLALFSAASILCAAASNLGLLIAARALQGVGGATMLTLAMALVAATTPKERIGAAVGLLGSMSAVGTALGPVIGGVLISWLDWPALFLINVPLGLAALALAGAFLPSDDASVGGDKKQRFDTIGTLLLALTLGAYALAMTMGRGQFGLINLALLLAAAGGLGLFVFSQVRSPSPLIRLSMLRDLELARALAASAIVAIVMMTTLIVGPFYLSGALGQSAVAVGLSMSVGPFVAALAAAPAGQLVDRLGAKRTGLAGLAGAALGCVLLAVSSGAIAYLAALALLTASYALFQAANSTMVITNASASDRGVASGMLNLSRNLGLVTGASVMGALFATASGVPALTGADPEAIAFAMRTTFLAAAVLVLVAIAIARSDRAKPVTS